MKQIQILLVEDSPNDRELALRSLNQINLANDIVIAEDGEEALDFIFCRGAHAGREMDCQPRLILLDIKLPKVDGIEVLRELKGDPRTKTIPVTIMTSSVEQRDVLDSYNLGVNSYIQKPVDFVKFQKVVAELGYYWLAVNKSPNA